MLILCNQTEAGCRFFINVLLIHAASSLSNSATSADIAPEIRIPETLFKSSGSSYGGAVNYMVIFGDTWARGSHFDDTEVIQH